MKLVRFGTRAIFGPQGEIQGRAACPQAAEFDRLSG